MDPRDERFLQGALAAGILDRASVERIMLARRATPSPEPIETWAVRTRTLTRDAVEKIFAFARRREERATEPTRAAPHDPDADLFLDSDQGGGRGASRPLLHERFGPYEILGEIARGGMGVVYRARGPARSEPVALKVLLEGEASTDEQVRRFEREILTGQLLDHPNIVKVLEGGRADGKLYFTMELVSGRSLDRLLPELPVKEKIAILEKVSRAVHHAHEKGFIHRDLKPQNVLVSEAGEPKVADFGLARSVARQSRLTKTGALVGTPYYMAPEQARGDHDAVDRRSDVYSLGAVIYQALTGRVPFQADTTLALVGLIVHEPPEDPVFLAPDCPPELATIALIALEKEPGDRFQTAEELANELAAWLAGRPVSATRTSGFRRLVRRAGRARRTIALIVVAAFVAFVPAGIIGWKMASARRVAREAARAKLEKDVVAAIGQAAKDVEPLLADRSRLARDAQPYRDALAELDRISREVADCEYEESRPVLAKAAASASLAEKRNALEGLLLIEDAGTAREQDLGSLKARLEKALEKAPSNDELRVALATVLDRQGAAESAALLLKDAATAPALERAGELRAALGDLRGSAAALGKALELEPGRSRAKLLLARTRFLAGDARATEGLDAADKAARVAFAEATSVGDLALGIDLLRSAEREQMADPETARRLGELLLRAERAEEARLALSRADELLPRDPRTLLARAEARLLEDDAKAIDDAVAAVEFAKPGSLLRARARTREAVLRTLLGSVEPRPATLLQAAFSERRGDLEVELASIELAAGGWGAPRSADLPEEDVARIARALGTRGAAATAWSLLAWNAAARKDEKAAAEAARCALAVDPAEPRALAALGAIGDAAARRAAHVAFLRSQHGGVRLLRASILRDRLDERFHHDEDRKAAADLLALSEMAAPWAAAPRIERARRVARAGDKAAAIERLSSAVELAGIDEDGGALLAHLLLEKDEKANAARAEELASRALAATPKHARALSARGHALLVLGRAADALPALEASLAEDPHQADAWAWKASALADLGRTVDAEKARAEASDRAHAREVAEAFQSKADGLTLNSHPDYQVGIPAYRRALDLDPTRAMASSRLGGHLILGFALYDDEPVFRLSQAAFWDPSGTMPEGDTMKSMSFAGDIAGNAARFEKTWREGGKIEDLWLSAYCRDMLVEGGDESPGALAASRLAFERVLCADQAVIPAHLYRGYVRALQNQAALATQDEERFLRYFPASSLAWYALAIGEAREGHREKARELLRTATEKETSIVERARHRAELRSLVDGGK